MKTKEIRVYGINADELEDSVEQIKLQDHLFTDDEWIEISEEQGYVWSLKGYAHSHNIDDIPYSIYIRFI